MRARSCGLLVSAVLMQIILIGLVNLAPSFGASETTPRISAHRVSELKVKIVFVGIERAWIDTSYMVWSENLLPDSINTVLVSRENTGVTYKFSYEFVFLEKTFKDKLLAFLKGIEIIATEENPYFYYWVQVRGEWQRRYMNVKAAFYDANRVEEWFYENRVDFGGLPEGGYALIFMYLPELPSATYKTMKEYWLQDPTKSTTSVFPHYYKISPADPDLGYAFRINGKYMTGWGGHFRLWFYDVSAGPSHWDDFSTLPLQVHLEDQKVNPWTAEGRRWLTQYVADFAAGAVMNFVAPNFVYAPLHTARYRFIVHVFDDRTAEEKEKVPIGSTINPRLIERAFRELTPYSDVVVEVIFKDTSDYPELKSIIETNKKALKDTIFNPPVSYVDVRPVYKFLQDNLRGFISEVRRDAGEFTVPAFAFAFSETFLFSYTYKWWHAMRDPETGLLLGVALGDLAIVSLNQWYFTRGDPVGQKGKGIGFTSTVIHELGHMIGLMHPHSYDWVGDFVVSAMGYYTRDYVFGQFDRDAVQRVHADALIMEVSRNIEEVRRTLESRVRSPELEALMKQISDVMKQAEEDYAKMNYAEAVKKIKGFVAQSAEAVGKAKALPLATVPLEEKIKAQEREIGGLKGEVSTLTEQLNKEKANVASLTEKLNAERARAEQLQLTLYIAIPVGIVLGIAVGLVVGRALARRKAAA